VSKQDLVRQVIRRLQGAQLEWETTKMRALVAGIAPASEEKFQIRSGGKELRRLTFRFVEGISCSVYNRPDSEEVVSWVEFTVNVFDAPRWRWNEWTEKAAEFRTLFDETVEDAATILGRPGFLGGYRDEGYPRDEGAVILAAWPVNNGELRVALRHEDRDVPMRLCITLKPQ
jgi:hypothetical protein